MLLGLSFALPPAVRADYTAAIPWLAMPVTIPGTQTVTALSSAFMPVAGSSFTWTLTGSGGPISTGLWCDSGAVNVGTNPYSFGSGATSGTMPSGSYTTCTMYGWAHGSSGTYAGTVSGASGTYTAGGTAATAPPTNPPIVFPNPTATPVPQSTVPPTAPPVTSDPHPTTPECRHGYRILDTDPTYGAAIHCQWWTYDAGTADGDPGANGEPGPWWIDLFDYGCSQALFAGYVVCSVNEQPTQWAVTLLESKAIPVPADKRSVKLWFGQNVDGGDTSTYDGLMYLALNFYAAGVETARELVSFNVADGNPMTHSIGPITIPDGVDRVRFTVGCVEGGLCGNASGAHRLDFAHLSWYELEGTPVEPEDEDECRVVVPSYVTPNAICPGRTVLIDPNTGMQYCGPLSGDCGDKPFLAPVFVPVCNAPAGALDVVGWLAHIACLVGALPAVILNVAIGAVNALIDLLFPGTLDDVGAYFSSVLRSRAVFGWVEPLAAALDGAWLTGGTAPVGFSTIEFANQDVALGDMLSEAMGQLAPFRGVMLSIIALGLLFKLGARVRSALGGGDTKDGTA